MQAEYYHYASEIADKMNTLQLKSLGNELAFVKNNRVAFPISGEYDSPDILALEKELRYLGVLKNGRSLTIIQSNDEAGYCTIRPNALDEDKLFGIDINNPTKMWAKDTKKSNARLDIADVAKYIEQIAPVPSTDKNDPENEGNPGAQLALIMKIAGIENPNEIQDAVKFLVNRHKSDKGMQENFTKTQKEIESARSKQSPTPL